MSEYYAVIRSDEYLEHHGIKGMKWGQRRFQNNDGSLTSAGKSRYNYKDARKYALYGGAIGYGYYRATHGPRDAKKVKAEKLRDKQARIRSKANKLATKYEKHNEKTYAVRKKISSRLSEEKRKEYNQWTRDLKTADKRISKTYRDYGEAKAKAAADKSYKNSDEYRNARKAYVDQRTGDLLGYHDTYRAMSTTAINSRRKKKK